jgi:hypothetical protein
MCPRTDSCSEIVAARDEGFVEHLKMTGCPECLALAQSILCREAKAAVNRFLQSLVSGESKGNGTFRQGRYRK